MEKYCEALEKWKESLSLYPSLDFNAAKKLYKDMFSTYDIQLKEEKRNELITGTLYVLYDFIKANLLLYLDNSSFSMDDIISACSEVWIQLIDAGNLLKFGDFNKLLDHEMFSRLAECLGISKREIDDSIIVDLKAFPFDLFEYIVISGKGSDILKKIYYRSASKELLHELFDSLFELLETDFDCGQLTRKMLCDVKELLLSIGLDNMRMNVDSLVVSGYEDAIVDDVYRKQMVDYMLNCGLLAEEYKRILIGRFGLDSGDELTYRELGEREHVSQETARHRECMAEARLRFSPRVNRFCKDYLE